MRGKDRGKWGWVIGDWGIRESGTWVLKYLGIQDMVRLNTET